MLCSVYCVARRGSPSQTNGDSIGILFWTSESTRSAPIPPRIDDLPSWAGAANCCINARSTSATTVASSVDAAPHLLPACPVVHATVCLLRVEIRHTATRSGTEQCRGEDNKAELMHPACRPAWRGGTGSTRFNRWRGRSGTHSCSGFHKAVHYWPLLLVTDGWIPWNERREGAWSRTNPEAQPLVYVACRRRPVRTWLGCTRREGWSRPSSRTGAPTRVLTVPAHVRDIVFIACTSLTAQAQRAHNLIYTLIGGSFWGLYINRRKIIEILTKKQNISPSIR